MREDMSEAVTNDRPISLRPFIDVAAGHYFSGDDDRQQKLDLLTHLIPYGGILLIWGESGIGKTTLLHYLETRVNESCRVCRLHAEDCVEPRKLVSRMLECFAWQSDVKYGSDGSQLRALRDHLGILHRNGYAPVLMIDDAEGLSDTAFGILEQLFDEQGQKLLTLVLAGTAELKKRMASPLLQPLAANIVHEFELPPLTAAEQAAYIQARLAWAGIDEMGPFHATTLKFIFAASRGMPRRINELAQVFWDNRKSDRNSGNAKPARPWLRQLRYVAPIVLISLGVALFNAPIRKALFPSPVSHTGVSTQHSEPLVTADNEPEEHATQPTSSADDKTVTGPSVAGVLSPQLEAPMAEASTAIGNEPAMHDTAEVSADDSTAVMAQVGSGQNNTPTLETATVEPPGVEAVETADRQAIESQTQLIGEAIVERTRAELAASESRQIEPAGTATDQEQWWLSQPADQYAVQLMAMSDDEVERYLHKHELAATVSTYRVKRGDNDLLAVAVGPFGDKADAEAQAQQWQLRLPGIRPWVRSVASIQQAVKAQSPESAVEWLARVKANEQQLLQAPANAYAVQLMAVDRKAVTDFVNKHGLADKVVYFRTRVDGQERYAALMEGFTDREQAMAAGHRVAAELKGVRPWVRSMASVQKVIRDYDDHPR